jgi:hypothetical protein
VHGNIINPFAAYIILQTSQGRKVFFLELKSSIPVFFQRRSNLWKLDDFGRPVGQWFVT